MPVTRRSSVDPCHSSAALGEPMRLDRPPARTMPARSSIPISLEFPDRGRIDSQLDRVAGLQAGGGGSGAFASTVRPSASKITRQTGPSGIVRTSRAGRVSPAPVSRHAPGGTATSPAADPSSRPGRTLSKPRMRAQSGSAGWSST